MSESKTKPIVPKFSSFKPKSRPPGAPEPQERKHTTKRRDRDDSVSYEERIAYTHHRNRSRSQEKWLKHRHIQQEVARSPPPPEDESPDIFTVDRRGDVKNLVYGENNRYTVPLFHRFGAGGVLGAPPSTKIDRSYGDEKGIVLSSPVYARSSLREKCLFSNIPKERPRLLKIRPELKPDPATRSMDFIPLQSEVRKRKQADVEHDSGSDQDVNYRSIHSKVKTNFQPVDEELQSATEGDVSGSECGRTMKLDEWTRRRTAELSKQVEQCPHNIDAWLALIEHQDVLLRPDDDRGRITGAEIRSTAEIKIHMYEKALDKVECLMDRERLLLGLMSEGAKIWEIKYQSDRWEEISKTNIDSLVLWKSYMNFKQTTFATFRYEEVKSIFLRRIKCLSSAVQLSGTDKNESLYKQLLYVLLRLTVYVRESGYSELAVAIWQGILEFNLFAPSSTIEEARKIALFKEFWDSEVPRIGEDKSLGWCNFIADQGSSEPPDPVVDQLEVKVSTKNVFRNWAESERLRSTASRLPARTLDDVAENDPFRVILASDIDEFLISLPSASQTLHRWLINAFLLFCHLPPLEGFSEEVTEDWSFDTFISGDFLEQHLERDPKQLPSNDEGIKVALSYVFNSTTMRFKASSESMFGLSWFRTLDSWQEHYAGDNGPVPYKWLRNAILQLVQTCFSEDLGEYYLAFQWRNEPDTIKKVSKTLLKQNPSSLRLYNAYARIEWSRGNKAIAVSVFSAALDLSKSMPDNLRRSSIILWQSWAWALLEDLENDIAVKQLLSIPAGVSNGSLCPSPAAILIAQQYLISTRDLLLSTGDVRHAVIHAECLALLEYLSSKSASETQSSVQGNISSALSAFSDCSQILRDRGLLSSTSHELLLQSAARLLYHHSCIGPFRPALLRQYLIEFLKFFPQNTIFLSLYTANESRLRIENRVRSILQSNILAPQNDNTFSRLFAIRYEISHGTIYSARSAFEHALASPASKSSVGLYRLYIKFCLKTPQFRPLAMDVWYRALRACPWAKILYILGLETMGGIAEFDELKSTWMVIGEKELRVHIDLFDEIGKLDNGGKG